MLSEAQDQAIERVAEHLRQFDRLKDSGGLIHSAYTDRNAEGADLMADDVRAVLALARRFQG